jgi:hypothetical protein
MMATVKVSASKGRNVVETGSPGLRLTLWMTFAASKSIGRKGAQQNWGGRLRGI